MRLACLASSLIACAVDPSGLPATEDGGGAVSDARVDFAMPDGRVLDLGPIDLGPIDQGPPDEGVDMDVIDVDLGPADMGPADMGPADMGPADLGPPDLGPPDMGPPDLGPPDLGSPDMGCGAAETCNAIDDDCDGAIDEMPGGSRGENVCPDPCVRAVSPGGVTYQLCPFDVTWTEARDACRLSGYELASPETMAEDTFLDSVLVGSSDYWIGLNDRGTEGTFVWSDQPSSRPLSSAFDDWLSGEPNNAPNGDGDCVRIERGSDQWRDSDCRDTGFFDGEERHSFACEAP